LDHQINKKIYEDVQTRKI